MTNQLETILTAILDRQDQGLAELAALRADVAAVAKAVVLLLTNDPAAPLDPDLLDAPVFSPSLWEQRERLLPRIPLAPKELAAVTKAIRDPAKLAAEVARLVELTNRAPEVSRKFASFKQAKMIQDSARLPAERSPRTAGDEAERQR